MQSIFENLKVGSLVEIEIMSPQNEMIKLKTIIEDITNESELKLFAPIYKGIAYPFRQNQSFTLITIFKHPSDDKYEIFSCRCKIVGKERDGNISTISIQKTSTPKKIQRRNYFRLPIIKDMTIIYNDTEYELMSRDLSGNGIRGYLSRKIPAESEAMLLLEMDENTTLRLNLRVIECNPDSEHLYRYDFRGAFVDLKSSEISDLTKYIFSKQAESIKKFLDFNEYISIIDSDKTYSDYFSMTNTEKIIRIIPIALWGLVFIQYAYMMAAFRDRNMGINFHFGELIPAFKPEFLITANLLAYIVIISSSLMLLIGLSYNKRKRLRLSISLIMQILLSIVTVVLHILYI